MKISIFAAASAAALALSVAGPANAASFVTQGDGVISFGSVTLDSTDVSPFDFTVEFEGYGGSPVNTITALTSLIDFTFTGATNDGKTFNFDFDVTNTSSVASMLTLFGFDVSDGLVPSTRNGSNTESPGADSTGLFDVQVVYGTGTVPNFGGVDVCFKTDGNLNNCSSGNSGVRSMPTPPATNTAAGTLMLNFASAPGTITLDRFVVRYQEVDPITGTTSAIGRGNVVPEPATWAMMIGGFGLVGAAMRRKKPTTVLA